MSGELMVSVTGIRDTTRDAVAGFVDALDQRGVAVSLLVTPRQPGGYRLLADQHTQQWLRSRRAGGDAIVLHGYDPSSRGRQAEFAALGSHEARMRLLAADRALEESGLRTRLFAPHRWHISAAAAAMLPGAGFRLLAAHSNIVDLERHTAVRARVHGVGGVGWEAANSQAEPWLCKTLLVAAGRLARQGKLLRLTVSGAQLGRPGPQQAVLDAVDLALHHGARPVSYHWQPHSRELAA